MQVFKHWRQKKLSLCCASNYLHIFEANNIEMKTASRQIKTDLQVNLEFNKINEAIKTLKTTVSEQVNIVAEKIILPKLLLN